MRALLLAALLVLAAATLAGCFSKPTTPTAYTLSATGGKVSPGWAYDGAGLVGGDATLAGYVSNPDNKGEFYVNFTYGGSKYQVIMGGPDAPFKQQEGKTWQDGGVAFGLSEHGSSGLGDASLPLIHGKVVTYGSAQIIRDGKPFVGTTGNLWSAHLMVYDDAVRGPDGKITKKDGATPYDPATPNDAKTYPGQSQAMLKLVHPDGMNATQPPSSVDANVSVSGPNANQTVDVPFAMGAAPFSIIVNSTSAAPPDAPVSVGAGTIAVTVTAGKGYTDSGNVAPNQPYSHTFAITAEDLAATTSPIRVFITGNGVYNVEVKATVPYDNPTFLVVTWDHPTLS